MQALTDAAIRSSFVNASRREVREAILPDLTDIDWDATDLLGWRDRKKTTPPTSCSRSTRHPWACA